MVWRALGASWFCLDLLYGYAGPPLPPLRGTLALGPAPGTAPMLLNRSPNRPEAIPMARPPVGRHSYPTRTAPEGVSWIL